MAVPTPGNPSGKYDSKRLREEIIAARKAGATDEQLAAELANHPVLGPKLAGKNPTEALNAAAFIYDDKYDPTEGMSGTDKFLAGAGRSFVNAAQGAKQFFGSPFVDQATRESWGAEQAERNRLDRPLTDTGAGFAGELVGDLALGSAVGGPVAGAAAKVLPAVARAPGVANLAARGARALGVGAPSAVAGGTLAPTEGTLSGFEDYLSKTGGDVLMGGAGDLAARGVGRMIKPLRFDVDPTLKARLDYLMQRGIGKDTPQNNRMGAFDAAQMTGDPTLTDLKESLSKLPAFSGGEARRRSAQLGDFTQSATSHAGTPVRTADPDTLAGLKKGMFDRLDEFTNGPNVHLGPNFSADVAARRATLGREASIVGLANKETMAPLDNAAAAARGGVRVLPAKDALKARSILGTEKHRGMKETATAVDDYRGQAAAGAQEAYDDAISDAFNRHSPGMADALDTWRKQDSVLMDIESAAGRAGGITKEGALNPKALAQVVSGRVGKRNMATGENELGRLSAEMGRLLDGTPNSGTTQRSLYSMLLLGGPKALTNAVENKGSLATVASMLGGPALANHLLHGKGVLGKKHIVNGAFGPKLSDPIIQMLLEMGPGAGANAFSGE